MMKEPQREGQPCGAGTVAEVGPFSGFGVRRRSLSSTRPRSDNSPSLISQPCLVTRRAGRPCLNELQKEYCVKAKVIALHWTDN